MVRFVRRFTKFCIDVNAVGAFRISTLLKMFKYCGSACCAETYLKIHVLDLALKDLLWAKR